MKRKKIPYGTKLPVTLTLRERDIIRDETFCDPDFARMAVVDGKRIKVELSLDDIEEIQGYIAAAANHTKNKRLQKELDRLFDKLLFFLDTYDDQRVYASYYVINYLQNRIISIFKLTLCDKHTIYCHIWKQRASHLQ
jgi:hypothetical protein